MPLSPTPALKNAPYFRVEALQDGEIEREHDYDFYDEEEFQLACKDFYFFQDDFEAVYIYECKYNYGTWSQYDISDEIVRTYDSATQKEVYRRNLNFKPLEDNPKWQPHPDEVLSDYSYDNSNSDGSDFVDATDEAQKKYGKFSKWDAEIMKNLNDKEKFNFVVKSIECNVPTDNSSCILKRMCDLEAKERIRLGASWILGINGYSSCGIAPMQRKELIKCLNENRYGNKGECRYARIRRDKLVNYYMRVPDAGLSIEQMDTVNKTRWEKMDKDRDYIFEKRKRQETKNFTDKELLENAMQGYKRVLELNNEQQKIIDELKQINNSLIEELEKKCSIVV